jgi:DNA-binding MarR family transcriptional regulator
LTTVPKLDVGDRDSVVSIQVVEGVFSLYERLRLDVATVMDQLGLTAALADALWALGKVDEPQSRRALAERLHCDPSNVTFLVERLAERRFVSAGVDPADRRVKTLQLTGAGHRALGRFAHALVNALETYGLEVDDQRQLADLLQKASLPNP